MKKNQFFALLAGTVGGLLFAVGMCMCLLPEWNAFDQGVAVAAAGGVILAALAIVGTAKSHKQRRAIPWKTVGKVVFGVAAALVLGLGMCLVMVWEQMLFGIAVGIAGIILLMCLLPICRGLK